MMRYEKRSFIYENVSELTSFGTYLQPHSNDYTQVEIIVANGRDNSLYLDISFKNVEEKEQSLKAINVILNDLTELREQILKHNFKKR